VSDAPPRPDRILPPETWRDSEDLRWAVRHWAARMGVRTPRVHVRAMRAKWASISTVGRLTLDVRLLALPRHLGEYVIVHELVHLLAPNHGRLMKSFLDTYLPDWERREQKLRSLTSRHLGARRPGRAPPQAQP
jgi:predicted metal-dependent hydrolase